MASRERLTIIPHGVPYMTKLLRYFMSEDSIFLHLEYVQGEGAFGMLSSFIPLKCRNLGRGGLSWCAAQTRGPSLAGGCRLGQAVWASVWCRGAGDILGRMFTSGLARRNLCRCPLGHHLLQSWLFSCF